MGGVETEVNEWPWQVGFVITTMLTIITMMMIIVVMMMVVMIDDHYGNVKSQAGMVWSGSSSVFCGATVIRFSIFVRLFEPIIKRLSNDILIGTNRKTRLMYIYRIRLQKKKISGKKCLEKMLLDRGRGCPTTKGKCLNLCLFFSTRSLYKMKSIKFQF